MQLEVHDQKLEKLLNDSNKLIRKVGLEMAKMVKKRFNEMKASPNFKEYVSYGLGKPHPLIGNFDKLYGIHLNKNYRLIVEPLVKVLDDINLEECKNVNIKGVVDYHDGKIEWLIP
ncbi:MAG: hypothetical protein HFH08_03610 [Bacilli bacterium]|nr:hypothetical protein [Bacilli bacterium]